MWISKARYTELTNQLKIIEELLVSICSKKCMHDEIIACVSNIIHHKHDSISNLIDNKLKEITTTIIEKYINSINKLLDWHKEIGTIMYLTGKLGVEDITKLKRVLQQPFLEQKWLETKVADAEKINKILESDGGKLRIFRDELHKNKLQLEKMGKSTAYIDGQLNIINQLIE